MMKKVFALITGIFLSLQLLAQTTGSLSVSVTTASTLHRRLLRKVQLLSERFVLPRKKTLDHRSRHRPIAGVPEDSA